MRSIFKITKEEWTELESSVMDEDHQIFLFRGGSASKLNVRRSRGLKVNHLRLCFPKLFRRHSGLL